MSVFLFTCTNKNDIFTDAVVKILFLSWKIIRNSWGKHKANQYHDGDFIPDKTYWRQKEY